jgi:hypothetical protein
MLETLTYSIPLLPSDLMAAPRYADTVLALCVGSKGLGGGVVGWGGMGGGTGRRAQQLDFAWRGAFARRIRARASLSKIVDYK